MFSFSEPQPCAVDNGGCQQDCTVVNGQTSCTCLNNYQPNGTACGRKWKLISNQTPALTMSIICLVIAFAVVIVGGFATVIVPEGLGSNPNYTVCAFLDRIIPLPILQILDSGR